MLKSRVWKFCMRCGSSHFLNDHNACANFLYNKVNDLREDSQSQAAIDGTTIQQLRNEVQALKREGE